jgi:hypothetical protein
MQSKPGAPKVIYISMNGDQIVDPMALFLTIGTSLIGVANVFDIDGTYIGNNPLKWISTVNVPPPKYLTSQSDREKILNIVAKKYEIFDVNVTDEQGVYENAGINNRYKAILTSRPKLQEYNDLINNKTENAAFPYSWRRYLVGCIDVSWWQVRQQTIPWIIFTSWYSLGWAPPKWVMYANRILGRDLSKVYPVFAFDHTHNQYVMDIADTNPATRLLRYSSTSGTEKAISYDVIAETIAHEIGHNFYLEHDGDLNAGSREDREYYKGHGVGQYSWGPIMGNPNPSIELTQWDKGEYFKSTNKSQSDIIEINRFLPFIKKPQKSKNIFTENNLKDFESDPAPFFLPPSWPKEKGFNVRVLTKSDVETLDNGQKIIKGMIGFPYDYDILKIMLPFGDYDFRIDPKDPDNEGTMFDPDMQLLNCHCQQSKDDNNPECNQNDLPSFYPENINQDKMQCIAFTTELGGSYTSLRSFGGNDGFTLRSLIINIGDGYSSGSGTNSAPRGYGIVYLRILGGYNVNADNGWSRYSSVGKYNIRIIKDLGKPTWSEDPNSFLPNSVLPHARCEEFEVCTKTGSEKILLYVKDGDGGSSGSTSEAHFKEYKIIKNGKIETKEFLVYGQPVDVNTPDDGKFYITVLDPATNQCKKQMFVIGSSWEKKTS